MVILGGWVFLMSEFSWDSQGNPGNPRDCQGIGRLGLSVGVGARKRTTKLRACETSGQLGQDVPASGLCLSQDVPASGLCLSHYSGGVDLSDAGQVFTRGLCEKLEKTHHFAGVHVSGSLALLAHKKQRSPRTLQ